MNDDKKQKKRLKRKEQKKKQKAKQRDAVEKTAKKMGMFERLPGECSACSKAFPKTREAHMSWQVVVRTEEQLVRLFCPECQEMASKIAEGARVEV
jgi:Zn finger protein HypA/HybF involved in hydrogenase expression